MHFLTSRLTDDLRRAAHDLLVDNDAGLYTKPSGGQYPHQWNWDSALISLGVAHFNPDRALQEIASLLKGQWADGMVPHIVFHDPQQAYFPDAGFWQTERHHPTGLPTSGITQPPVVASTLRAIAKHHDISDFVRTWYPALVKWHRWFHVTRCTDSTGLTMAVHPWETGMDDSPRWLKVMGKFKPTDLPAYERVDRNHVAASQRPGDKDYERFVYLVDRQRQADWNPRVALETSPFCVQDVLTNSVLLRADEDLIWLGKSLGLPTDDIENLRAKALTSFHDRFWNEERGLFLDYDVRSGKTINVNTAATFLPLWAGVANESQAEALMVHLKNPAEYWTEPGEGYMVSTCARNESAWSPVRYWRGPIWVLTNWFVHGGLHRYGQFELAERVRNDTLKLLSQDGFVEYYNANTGAGCGARAFSWSAALALDLLDHS